MIVFNGIKGLLASKKGVVTILMLGVTTLIALTGHMDPAVAACLAAAQGVFCWTAHKTDIAAMQMPERGR